MGKTSGGHVQWRGGEWKTRVTDPATGVRRWIGLEDDLPLEQRLKKDQKALAEKLATAVQRSWHAGGYVPSERRRTVNEFFRLWCESRRGRYPNQVETDEQAFRLWIGPQLGTLPFEDVTRDRLIAFSHWLDEKAREGVDFGPKRARNIFAVVSAMFRDAYSSKDPKIRVLDSNPCADVPWPEKAEGDPLHQLLYPNEFEALVSCPDVPRVRARLYAVALYTMTRIGEVRVLECKDIDLDHGLVKIVKASDSRRKGQTKLTKSGRSRIVTLEQTLAPVLEAMIGERGSGRLFLSRPSDAPKGNQYTKAEADYIHATSKVCEVFRRDLRRALAWAGIRERPELFDDTDLRANHPIRFHDLRASGITWRHARGDNAAIIRQECGHEDARTNEIYIRRLRELRTAELFGRLPERLLSASENMDQIWTNGPDDPPNSRGKGCRRRESNPASDDANGSEKPSDCEDPPPSDGPNGTRSRPSEPTATDHIAEALHLAAQAGRWELVEALSRILADLRRSSAPGPALSLVKGKQA